MHADAPDDQQPRVLFPDVLDDFFERLAVQQGGPDVGVLRLGQFTRDIQVRLVDLGQPAVDDLLVQFLLLLEAEDLARFLVQHPRDAVERGIMEIRVEGGDRLDGFAQRLAQGQPRHEPAEGVVASIHRHDDLAAVHRLGVFDDQHVGGPHAAHDSLGVAPDHAVLHRADAQRAHDDQFIAVGVDVLSQHLPVPALQGPALQRQVGFRAFLIDVIEVGIGDDLESAGDQGVVDLALSVQLLLVVVFLRKAGLHLLEPLVVHLGRIDVAPHDFRPESLGQGDSQVNGHIGKVRIIDGDINGLIHQTPPPECGAGLPSAP